MSEMSSARRPFSFVEQRFRVLPAILSSAAASPGSVARVACLITSAAAPPGRT
eukprot:CAMPEP_0115717160 /NCGR_PEP_ID=MMETSP0272-20121206/76720_1 /TAXON_ID=71861 /ORGANISM="Scrippsiella trochoidea, Strain CCMP3099" /LENGTH=52 /DNA_ID=CAMNT_0003159545 /DNA_START=96 /DNA_END=251 /DNA_ORIENTATION=+